jgi:hypothetical protein
MSCLTPLTDRLCQGKGSWATGGSRSQPGVGKATRGLQQATACGARLSELQAGARRPCDAWRLGTCLAALAAPRAQVVAGTKPSRAVLLEFLAVFEAAGGGTVGDGQVTLEEFQKYYEHIRWEGWADARAPSCVRGVGKGQRRRGGLLLGGRAGMGMGGADLPLVLPSHASANIDEGPSGDDYFELMMRNVWHISGGEGWCANTTCKRVLVVFNDDSQVGRKSDRRTHTGREPHTQRPALAVAWRGTRRRVTDALHSETHTQRESCTGMPAWRCAWGLQPVRGRAGASRPARAPTGRPGTRLGRPCLLALPPASCGLPGHARTHACPTHPLPGLARAESGGADGRLRHGHEGSGGREGQAGGAGRGGAA